MHFSTLAASALLGICSIAVAQKAVVCSDELPYWLSLGEYLQGTEPVDDVKFLLNAKGQFRLAVTGRHNSPFVTPMNPIDPAAAMAVKEDGHLIFEADSGSGTESELMGLDNFFSSRVDTAAQNPDNGPFCMKVERDRRARIRDSNDEPVMAHPDPRGNVSITSLDSGRMNFLRTGEYVVSASKQHWIYLDFDGTLRTSSKEKFNIGSGSKYPNILTLASDGSISLQDSVGRPQSLSIFPAVGQPNVGQYVLDVTDEGSIRIRYVPDPAAFTWTYALKYTPTTTAAPTPSPTLSPQVKFFSQPGYTGDSTSYPIGANSCVDLGDSKINIFQSAEWDLNASVNQAVQMCFFAYRNYDVAGFYKCVPFTNGRVADLATLELVKDVDSVIITSGLPVPSIRMFPSNDFVGGENAFPMTLNNCVDLGNKKNLFNSAKWDLAIINNPNAQICFFSFPNCDASGYFRCAPFKQNSVSNTKNAFDMLTDVDSVIVTTNPPAAPSLNFFSQPNFGGESSKYTLGFDQCLGLGSKSNFFQSVKWDQSLINNKNYFMCLFAWPNCDYAQSYYCVPFSQGAVQTLASAGFQADTDSVKIVANMPAPSYCGKCGGSNSLFQHDGSKDSLYRPNQFTNSFNQRFVVQQDGNVVIYDGTSAVWSTQTSNRGGVRLRLEPGDGVLRLWTGEHVPVWSAGSGGQNLCATFQADRNFVLYDKSCRAIWNTGTNTDNSQPTYVHKINRMRTDLNLNSLTVDGNLQNDAVNMARTSANQACNLDVIGGFRAAYYGGSHPDVLIEALNDWAREGSGDSHACQLAYNVASRVGCAAASGSHPQYGTCWTVVCNFNRIRGDGGNCPGFPRNNWPNGL